MESFESEADNTCNYWNNSIWLTYNFEMCSWRVPQKRALATWWWSRTYFLNKWKLVRIHFNLEKVFSLSHKYQISPEFSFSFHLTKFCNISYTEIPSINNQNILLMKEAKNVNHIQNWRKKNIQHPFFINKDISHPKLPKKKKPYVHLLQMKYQFFFTTCLVKNLQFFLPVLL